MQSSAELHSENEKGDLRVPFFQLTGFLDPVTLQALGADPNPFGRAIHQHPHRLEIGIPTPLGSIVGVADVVAGDRPFGAHGAYPCHKLHPYIMSGRDEPPNVTRARP